MIFLLHYIRMIDFWLKIEYCSKILKSKKSIRSSSSMGCYWACIEIGVSLFVAFVGGCSFILALLLSSLLLLYL